LARQRNYHAEYQRRKERAAKLTPYQATHRRGGTAPVFLQGFDQVTTVKLSYAESKRAGRYDSLVAKLTKGQISEREFDRTVKRWKPLTVQAGSEIPAGQYRFADADSALYLAESAKELSDREYHERMHFDIQGS
jgi:hypothetical protein